MRGYLNRGGFTWGMRDARRILCDRERAARERAHLATLEQLVERAFPPGAVLRVRIRRKMHA